jgi:hypothetical protein
MIIFVFFNFLAFWPFQKNQPLTAQLHTVAIETKKGGLKHFLDSFHQTS